MRVLASFVFTDFTMVSSALKVAVGAIVANLVIWIALVGGPGDFYEVRSAVSVNCCVLHFRALYPFTRMAAPCSGRHEGGAFR